jgi:hypothetical protein
VVVRVVAVVGAALLGIGCRGYHDTEQSAQWTDAGRLCVVPAEDPSVGLRPTPPDDVALEPDAPLVAGVFFSAFEWCVSNLATSCSVVPGDSLVEVSSSATYDIVPEGDCGAGCEPVTATCTAGSFAAGTVTFEHGGDLLVLELPSATYPCIGETAAPDIVPQ